MQSIWGQADNKKPRRSEVSSVACGWEPQSTLYYVNTESIRVPRRTRNFGTNFDVFSA